MPTLTLDRTPGGWDEAHDGYDRHVVPFTAQFARSAFELAAPASGARVLDVAAGPGTLALLAARAGMDVMATDFSPAMIGRLREHIRDEKLSNIAADVMDGQALDLPDAAYDAAFSIFGLIFFPDRAKGFAELHRVLRPGGKAVVTAWCPPDRFRLMGVIGKALGVAFPDMPPPAEPPAALSLADPAVFEAEMRAGGFETVEIRSVTHPYQADTARDVFDRFQTAAPPLRAMVAGLSPEQLRTFKETVVELLRADFGDGPISLPCEAHVGIGIK